MTEGEIWITRILLVTGEPLIVFKQTNAQTEGQTDRHRHTQTLTYTPTHAHTYIDTHAQTHTHTYSHARAHAIEVPTCIDVNFETRGSSLLEASNDSASVQTESRMPLQDVKDLVNCFSSFLLPFGWNVDRVTKITKRGLQLLTRHH